MIIGATLLLIAASGGWRPGRAQPPAGRVAIAAPAAWTNTATTGTVGMAALADTPEAPGASCRIDRRFTPAFMDIIANGPTVSPSPGVTDQVVSWRITLVQIGPGSAESVIGTTSAATHTATATQPAVLPALEFLAQPLGPRYVVDATVSWHDPAQSTDIVGMATFRIAYYRPLNELGTPLGRAGNSCRSPETPSAGIPTPRGTVNGRVAFSLGGVPIATTLTMTWDGRAVGSIVTDESGQYAGTFLVPATTIGWHTAAWSAGTWTASARFEVVPRIKITPGTVARGQRVDVSLRGFAKKETVRIRWKRGGSWVELVTVQTSNTGSANVWVTVPAWAADGTHAARGDGPTARAQTNAITVAAGPLRAAEEAATATPSSTEPPAPTTTVTPAADATATASPTAPTEPSPTATATPESIEPTATPAPTNTPTPPVPTPTPEPTATPEPASPTPTPEPTATPTVPPSAP